MEDRVDEIAVKVGILATYFRVLKKIVAWGMEENGLISHGLLRKRTSYSQIRASLSYSGIRFRYEFGDRVQKRTRNVSEHDDQQHQ